MLSFASQCIQLAKEANVPFNFNFNLNLPFSPSVNSTSDVGSSSSPASDARTEIPEFKYIHVSVTDDTERAQVNKMVFHIVRLPRMQLICDELYKLMKHRKVLSSIKPEFMLAELRRIGIPSADIPGFSDQNFYHYYRAPKID